MGKKCKQRFLKVDRKDSYISKSWRGYGGNVASLTCTTIAQKHIPSDVIQQFRDGEKISLLFTHMLVEFVQCVVVQFNSTAIYHQVQDTTSTHQSSSPGGKDIHHYHVAMQESNPLFSMLIIPTSSKQQCK